MYKISNHFADNLLQLRDIREVSSFRLSKYHVDWLKILETCFKHMYIKDTFFYDITSFSRDSNMSFNIYDSTRLTLLFMFVPNVVIKKQIVSTNLI